MVLKKQKEMAETPGTTAAAATAAAAATSAMDAVAKMFGSATPSQDQIAVVREARDKFVAAAPGPACPPAGHVAADAVAAMFGSATPNADAIAGKLSEAVSRRAVLKAGGSNAKGKGPATAAATPSSGAAAGPIDEAVLAKLEADFKSFQSTFTKLQGELSDANQRISIVEKFSSMESKLARRSSSKEKKSAAPGGSAAAPSSGAAAAAAAAARAAAVLPADGTVTIAKGDAVLSMLQAYLETGLNVKVKVDSKASVSSYSYNNGAKVEGATAVLNAVAGGMVGGTPLDRGKVMQWCFWGEAGKGEINVKTFLGQLDAHLAGAVYIAGFDFTIADLICFTAVRSYLRDKSGSDREETPHLCRWFNCVQHAKGLGATPIFFCANALNWRVAEHA